ncbi:MAG: tail fiber domain-containing protein [Bacteroidetes bacterium]|nr:tail fiber domain-containing protein [Bacteroidota bacterium]
MGIGTASPVNALDVVGDVNVKAGSLSIRTGLILTPTAGNSSTGYSPLVLQNYAGKNVFKIQQEVSSDSSIFFQTDAANNGASELTRMVIKRATGNIGIGTSTPSEKLTVVDNSGANYVMSLLESKSATTGPAGSGTTLLLQNNNSTTNNFSGINFRNSNGLPVASMIAINKNHSAATGTGQLSFWITNSGTSTEKMRIDENGYVGIGTSTPTVALDVVGGVRIKGGSGLTLTPTGGSSSSGYSPFFIQNNAGNNVFALQQEYGSDSTSMFFLTDALNNGATYNIRMVIKRATGYIGMGTSAPNSKLDVASNDDMVGRFESFSSDPTGVVTIVVPNSNTNCNTCSELSMFKKATGSIMGSISSNLSSSTVAYNTTSDIRLKENIKPSHFSINDLMKIQVADYTRISDSTKTVETGYLAQQLYSVFPSAVTPGGEDAKSKPWMVDYGRITPLIIKSVQDQQAEIEALKAELAQLKALINKIEAVK